MSDRMKINLAKYGITSGLALAMIWTYCSTRELFQQVPTIYRRAISSCDLELKVKEPVSCIEVFVSTELIESKSFLVGAIEVLVRMRHEVDDVALLYIQQDNRYLARYVLCGSAL